MSCSATRPIPLIQEKTHLQRDTIYLNSQRYDSVYVSHERTQEYRLGKVRAERLEVRDSIPLGYFPNPSTLTPNPDTVVITDVKTEYRYRLLKDTVESVKLEVIRDSIPYPVEIEVIKEIPRKRTWFDMLSCISLGILVGMLGIKLTGSKLSKLIKF